MLNDILASLLSAGATQILEVGGAVRDRLLGIEPKDIDIEVYGLAQDKLESVLAPFGKMSICGQSFGVTKLSTPDGKEYDFSLPRRESKCGVGHKGFNVEFDEGLTPEEAASRRDFTINSMARNPLTGEIIDPFGGQADLEYGILRATSKQFSEDPLRVLRGFQFSSRFGLVNSVITVDMCRQLKLEYSTLPKERVFQEFVKWAEKGLYPEYGLAFLRTTGWVYLFDELANLIGCPQDPFWHPEGDGWVHTLFVCKKMSDLVPIGHPRRLVLMLAALCHDFGKPECTKFERGHIRSNGHDAVGAIIAQQFLESIGCFPEVTKQVVILVREHMVHVYGTPTDRSVKRLSVRLGRDVSIDDLMLLIEADHGGRPPLPAGLPEKAKQIMEIAKRLGVQYQEEKPIVMGRHLIEWGLIPSPQFTNILDRLFEAQLDGRFSTPEEASLIFDEERDQYV